MQDFSDLKKKILVNWFKLFSGSSVGAALGLFATILMTRSIGVTDVGIVSVVQTFWRMLEQFLSFQSYQVLIKNGADILHGQSDKSFRALVKLCMVADLSMAGFGAAAGLVCVAFFHAKMNIPDEMLPVALLGVFTMLTMVTGASMGVLRLYDRLNVVALRDVAVSGLRILFNGVAFFYHPTAVVFIGIWVATESCGNLLILFYGFRELNKQGYGNIFGADLRDSRSIPAGTILKALFTVNFGTMARILSEEGDTLLVNAFTGAAAAGKYKIAKNFSGIVYKFVGPLAQSIYPEIAKAVSERNRGKFRHIMLYTSLQGGALGLCAFAGWAVLGTWLLDLTVGPAYRDALPTILIITGGYATAFFGIGFNPALYAFNKLNQYLASAILCTLAYFVIALPLMPTLGMNGSAWGQVACYMSGFIISAFMVYKSYHSTNWA